MPAYVDAAYVKLVGSMPAEDIDDLEIRYPGLFDQLALAVSRTFDARLLKRYAAPFVDPPETLKWHVAHVVAAALWQKRGYNPGSAQDQIIETNRVEALAWLKDAADSKEGLVELPRREDQPGVSGISRGGPLFYSEASPYAWLDDELARARVEDRNR